MSPHDALANGATADYAATVMHYDIRDAAQEDFGAIAQLHAASWKVAYRGIRPDAFLDGDLENT